MKVGDFDPARRAVLHALGLADDKAVFMLNGYPAVHLHGSPRYVHRMAASVALGKPLARSQYVHHMNEDRTDFTQANLQVCTLAEHNRLHRRCGQANHFFGKRHTAAAKAKLSAIATSRDRELDGSGRFAGGRA